MALAAPFFGYSALDYEQVFNFSIPPEENADAAIFFDLRLARVVFAALVGGALATAGAVFQVALRNDLATPYTLGISGGATLGTLAAIKMGAMGAGMATGGLLGAAVAVVAILALARSLRGSGESTVTLLLAGVTLNLVFGSVVLLVQYLSNPYETFFIVRWLMGGVDVVGLGRSAWLGPFLLAGFLVLWAQAQPLNLINLDDQTARSLGENPDRRRLQVVAVAAALTALVVAFAGPIGFVGLIIPHGVRRVLGADNRFVLPGSALAGAAFLVLADTVGRTVGGAQEVPVGVVTALVGGPVFLGILLRRRG